MDWVNDFIGEKSDTLEIGTEVLGDLSGKLLVVRVGNEDRPASENDIDGVLDAMRIAVKTLKKEARPAATIVTHHVMDFEVSSDLSPLQDPSIRLVDVDDQEEGD